MAQFIFRGATTYLTAVIKRNTGGGQSTRIAAQNLAVRVAYLVGAAGESTVKKGSYHAFDVDDALTPC